MNYTKEKPKEEGYYWMMEYPDAIPEVVYVEENGEFCRIGGGTYMSEDPIEGSLWYGPLKPPIAKVEPQENNHD
jgi:hypothetical protein